MVKLIYVGSPDLMPWYTAILIKAFDRQISNMCSVCELSGMVTVTNDFLYNFLFNVQMF